MQLELPCVLYITCSAKVLKEIFICFILLESDWMKETQVLDNRGLWFSLSFSLSLSLSFSLFSFSFFFFFLFFSFPFFFFLFVEEEDGLPPPEGPEVHRKYLISKLLFVTCHVNKYGQSNWNVMYWMWAMNAIGVAMCTVHNVQCQSLERDFHCSPMAKASSALTRLDEGNPSAW